MWTTEVWTCRGLVTFYTVFVIELASRRVQILGSTPHPDDAVMTQVVRTLTMADQRCCRVLICDRDAKWSAAVRIRLHEAGIRVVQTPLQTPNANAYAERFVRSIKEECLDWMIPLGERHFRRALREFVDHYHGERNQRTCEPVDRGTTSTRRRRSGASTCATGRAPKLLRARGGMITGSADNWDRTAYFSAGNWLLRLDSNQQPSG